MLYGTKSKHLHPRERSSGMAYLLTNFNFKVTANAVYVLVRDLNLLF
jgi:hypothetical protein